MIALLPVALILVGCQPAADENCRPEVPYDGVDQDCDGSDLVDVDDDGFDAMEAGGDDCDDARADTFPGASDTAGDGSDADCDGIDGVDEDRDTFASSASGGPDCDDSDPAVFPGAEDPPYDDLDQDCAGDCDWDADADGAPASDAPLAEGDACDVVPGDGVPAPDCDDADASASWSLVSTAPAADEQILVDSVFRATFDGNAAGAVLLLTDGAGSAVAGTSTLEGDLGEIAVFTPDEPLLGGASYTFSVAAGCGGASVPVTTLVDPAALVGQMWQLDWASGEWTLPGSPVELVFRVVLGSEAVQLEMIADGVLRVGSGLTQFAPFTQDLCAPTTDAAFDLADNPRFSFVPAHIQAAGVALPLENALVTGRIANGGGLVTEVRLTGSIDVSPLDAVVEGGSACATLEDFLLACEPCPVSGAVTCITAQIDDIPTERIAGSPMVVRTEADVALDPACN